MARCCSCRAEAGARGWALWSHPRSSEEPVNREIHGTLEKDLAHLDGQALEWFPRGSGEVNGSPLWSLLSGSSLRVAASGQAYCPRAWLWEDPSASSRCFCSPAPHPRIDMGSSQASGHLAGACVWTRSTPLCAATQAHFFSPGPPTCRVGKKQLLLSPIPARHKG